MTQQSGRQYDDDLTLGADEYSETFSTQYVDLFEPLGEEDSPIAKLKTIILSIDWEINDDILDQLNDELQDLKDVWAGNKIHQVYLQALEKIGRYIYTEKANAHPNAIKLLLTFYYNLEKIASSDTMSEAEKRQLLLQDVKKFDQFKAQLSQQTQSQRDDSAEIVTPPPIIEPTSSKAFGATKKQGAQKGVLSNLKALVWGIDWEISDKDLVRLGEEVSKLEKIFSESRAKLIFLQGIGALGNYIKSAKSSAHLDAFKLLHSFYEGLERAYLDVLSPDEEKELLLVEVRKFNAFKAEIAAVATEVVVPREKVSSSESSIGLEEEEEDDEEGSGGTVTPAFSDVPSDVHGFREEAEATQKDIDKRLASFLGEDDEEDVAPPPRPVDTEGGEVGDRLEALFGEDSGGPLEEVSPLSGVDVETEADDDSDEKALPVDGDELAPALAGSSGRSQFMEVPSVQEPPAASRAEDIDAAPIPGVDVETEADDDSDEAALPQYQGGVAPALSFVEEEKGFDEHTVVSDAGDEHLDLEERLHSFFGAEIEDAAQVTGASEVDQSETPAVFADESTLVEGGVEEIPDGVVDEQSWDEGETSDLLSVLDDDSHVDELFPPVAKAEDVEPEETLSADLVADEVSPISEDELEREAVGEPPLDAGVDAEEAPVSFMECLEDDEERGAVLLAPAVIFEPVGDEVEIDALPDERYAADGEGLTSLRESIALIRDKQYDLAFPAFFAQTARLNSEWRSWLTGRLIVQLLVVVAQYIQRAQQDDGSDRAEQLLLILVDALGRVHLLEQHEGEQLLYEMTDKVLSWQQGLLFGSGTQQ